MKRFYKYVLYRVYEWRIKENDQIPVVATFVALFVVHMAQFGFLLLLLAAVSDPFNSFFQRLGKLEIALFVFSIGLLFYVFVIQRANWERWKILYGNENSKTRSKGSVLVLAFTLGSILFFLLACLFFIIITG